MSEEKWKSGDTLYTNLWSRGDEWYYTITTSIPIHQPWITTDKVHGPFPTEAEANADSSRYIREIAGPCVIIPKPLVRH